jgi:CO/xanthine dehydrogenase Mo-binding subunit
VPLADICYTNWQITGTANNPPYYSIVDPKTGKVIHAYSAAVTIAEVEVDTETGKMGLLRVVTGHDCGRIINPIIIENQIDLGIVMAHGWLKTEEFVTDARTGAMINSNLLDYKLSTFLDLPKSGEVQRIIAEKSCAWGPFGAKGFAETAMSALGPAMANAFYNATGKRFHAGSLSPANVLIALGS